MSDHKNEAINFLKRKASHRTSFHKVALLHRVSKQVVNSYPAKVPTGEDVSFIVDWQLSAHEKIER
ncbi:hypothetical protein [Sunxiuqinia sp. sy24]|uniref:hypothetical protein n=1 Tax=Sunxiuqinia sp. sy24 TaxID=3461495 RepID=UPI00404640AA